MLLIDYSSKSTVSLHMSSCDRRIGSAENPLIYVLILQELSSLEEKMEYQLEERTRDMQDVLESCQTKVF